MRFVSCGSRRADVCPFCAEMYRGDWARVLRSGALPHEDGPSTEQLSEFRFFFLTLTAPSFGATHHVPKRKSQIKKCRCGKTHSVDDMQFRGIPIKMNDYKFSEQVRWNYGSSALWNSTRTSLEKALPGWDYAAIREWQSRGTVHLHILIRIPRTVDVSGSDIESLARRCTVTVNGERLSWGRQSDIREIGGDPESDVRATGYLAKALTYSAKSFSNYLIRDNVPNFRYVEFVSRLDRAARRFRCDKCNSVQQCDSLCHEQFGYSGRLISISVGWSLIGLTRTELRRRRAAWAAAHGGNFDRLDDKTRAVVERARVAWASGSSLSGADLDALVASGLVDPEPVSEQVSPVDAVSAVMQILAPRVAGVSGEHGPRPRADAAP